MASGKAQWPTRGTIAAHEKNYDRFGITEKAGQKAKQRVQTLLKAGLELDWGYTQMRELLEESLVEIIMDEFNLNVEGAITTWINAQLSSLGGAVVKQVLGGGLSTLRKALTAVVGIVVKKIANEMLLEQTNAIFNEMWLQMERKPLFNGNPRVVETEVRLRHRVK